MLKTFEFYDMWVRVSQTPDGVTAELSSDKTFPADDTSVYQSRSRSPYCIAALLATDLDVQWPYELEALASSIDMCL